MRLFIALNLPPSVRDNVKNTQTALRRQIGSDAIKWATPENLHLTLHFFGDVDEKNRSSIEENMRAGCAATAPFSLSISQAACLPNKRRPRVLYLALGGEIAALRQLQSRVSLAVSQLGSQQETKVFTPHLTLGRIKNFDGIEIQKIARAVEKFSIEEVLWPVREIELMHSELTPRGPIYTSLALVKL